MHKKQTNKIKAVSILAMGLCGVVWTPDSTGRPLYRDGFDQDHSSEERKAWVQQGWERMKREGDFPQFLNNPGLLVHLASLVGSQRFVVAKGVRYQFCPNEHGGFFQIQQAGASVSWSAESLLSAARLAHGVKLPPVIPSAFGLQGEEFYRFVPSFFHDECNPVSPGIVVMPSAEQDELKALQSTPSGLIVSAFGEKDINSFCDMCRRASRSAPITEGPNVTQAADLNHTFGPAALTLATNLPYLLKAHPNIADSLRAYYNGSPQDWENMLHIPCQIYGMPTVDTSATLEELKSLPEISGTVPLVRNILDTGSASIVIISHTHMKTDCLMLTFTRDDICGNKAAICMIPKDIAQKIGKKPDTSPQQTPASSVGSSEVELGVLD